MARKDKDVLDAKAALAAAIVSARPSLTASIEAAVETAVSDYLTADATAPFPIKITADVKIVELGNGSPNFVSWKTVIKFREESS